jgi:4-hydroxybenzoate polyprenyltransferase
MNLFIIALLFYIIRCCVVRLFSGNELFFSELAFFSLTFSTVCITAGGYVINAYFDRQIDEINKPNRIIVGRDVSTLTTIQTHLVLSLAGLLFGGAVAVSYNIYSLIVIQLSSVLLLWYYSLKLKRMVFVGNLIVAVLSAAVPLLAGVYEFNNPYMDVPMSILLGFAGFAFLFTFAREVIKDFEDQEGDEKLGCRTLPIVWGKKASIWFVGLLLILTTGGLVWIQQFACILGDYITPVYFLLTVQLPSIYLIFRLIKSKTPKDYLAISRLLKAIMLAGILYGIVLFFIY